MTHKDIVATLDVGEDDEEDYDAAACLQEL